MNTLILLEQERFRSLLIEKSARQKMVKVFTLEDTKEILFYLDDLKPFALLLDLETLFQQDDWQNIMQSLAYHPERSQFSLLVLGSDELIHQIEAQFPINGHMSYPLQIDELMDHLHQLILY